MKQCAFKALRKVFLITSGVLSILSFPIDGQAKNDWEKLQSTHFIIYYKEAPLDFVQGVEKAAEQYYGEIADNLGYTRYESWTYDKRAKIYIYNDQEDYVVSARQFKWSHGSASVKTKEIRTFPSAHGFFDSTLPHELGHIIFREFIGFSGQVPGWMDEGVAMYQEKAKRWGANKAVKQAIAAKKFMPLHELTYMTLYSETPQETVDLFYSEAASVTYYIITELGKVRFGYFCEKLKQGSSLDNALNYAFPRIKDLDALNKAWLEYLKE